MEELKRILQEIDDLYHERIRDEQMDSIFWLAVSWIAFITLMIAAWMM